MSVELKEKVSNEVGTQLVSEVFNTHAPFAEEAFLKDKPSTGVCFSGGGTRAMVLAMGQLRGIEKLGLMKNVKYISSVSGGSWASTLYAFRKKDDTKALLGEYKEPSELSLKVLQENEPDMAYPNRATFSPRQGRVLPNFLMQAILSLLKAYKGEIEVSQVWQFIVAQLYFSTSANVVSNFHTDHFSFNEETQKAFEEMNPAFKEQKNKVFLQNKNSPYLIINGVITNLEGHNKLVKDYVGIEFTPIYTMVANGSKIKKEPFTEKVFIGDGALNTLAMGGKPVDSKEEKVTVSQAKAPLGLAAAAGISSHFAGGFIANEAQWFLDLLFKFKSNDTDKILKDLGAEDNILIKRALNEVFEYSNKNDTVSFNDWVNALLDNPAMLNPKLDLFSPHNFKKSQPEYGTFRLADGGTMENYGIMPMLRRKVKRIVVFINSDVPLSLESIKDYGSISGNVIEDTLTSLFGVLKSPFWRPGRNFTHNHVFEARSSSYNGIKDVIEKLQKAKRNNEAVIAETKHRVIKNSWWGIEPYDVEVCWVYNEVVANWENALPRETQRELNLGSYRSSSDSENSFSSSFPLLGTVKSTLSGLSKMELNMLGHIGAWNVAGQENQEAFKKILRAD